jgi:hypothetical protein
MTLFPGLFCSVSAAFLQRFCSAFSAFLQRSRALSRHADQEPHGGLSRFTGASRRRLSPPGRQACAQTRDRNIAMMT